MARPSIYYSLLEIKAGLDVQNVLVHKGQIENTDQRESADGTPLPVVFIWLRELACDWPLKSSWLPIGSSGKLVIAGDHLTQDVIDAKWLAASCHVKSDKNSTTV